MNYREILNPTKSAYRHLQDDESCFLYEKRSMWALTGDDRFVNDIIDSVFDRKAADEMMARAKEVSDRLYIRGAGNEYHTIKKYYPDIEFCAFVDRDPVKISMGTIDGHKVISPDEFYEGNRDRYIIVNSSAFSEEIARELKDHGVPEDHIFNFGNLSRSTEQYFEPGIIKPIEHEIFVDGGCYDGTTFRNFVKWCNGNYDAIFSFEPDRQNYEVTSGSLEKDPVANVNLFNKGLWDKDETLYFNASGTQGSGIVDGQNSGSSTVSIETTSIDKALNGAPATFIKLDVEGAEYEALIGAEETIKKHHPRMAISIYHKPEDIFTLPELVLSFSDEYRLYLRHYQLSRFETILYAI